MALVDRFEEQRLLAGAWQRAERGDPQLVVLWGRRRVGKTYLLAHFAREKPSLLFPATRQSQTVELRRLAELTRAELGDEAADLAGGVFADWERALRFFVALSRQRPLLLILDEVPYLARSTQGFASIVQAVWDHIQPPARLMIVLTGSAIGTMEQILSGPLHERPTLRWRMDPLGPDQARLFLPRLTPESFLEAYAACGGYPLHLSAWDEEQSTIQNLVRLAGTPAGVLLEAALSILGEEVGDDGYRRVLGALGRGVTRYSELANEAGQRIEHALDVLVRTGFVRRVLPVGAPRGASPTYAIDDTYLAFWFRVLAADYELIEGGQGRAVLARASQRWEAHVAATFEEAARGHAARLVREGRFPSDLVIGRWWASSGTPCEIDVLGLRGSHTALLGEVKWQRDPVGQAELISLQRRLGCVPSPVDEPRFVLYGRTCSDLSDRHGVSCFTASDVFEEAEGRAEA